MKSKALWKIAVVTTAEAEDAVAELLQNLCGATASSWTDVESGETTVAVYLQTTPNRRTLLAALSSGLERIARCGLKAGSGRIIFQKLRAQDWAESWKRHFPPLEVSRALLVRPGWSRRRARRGQAVVVLDPGLSFGTGRHPTTAFCLRQLAVRRNRNVRQSFLDIGTGSGILAIAAAKLGYAPVEAFDFDPESVRVARANIRRNRVADKVRLRRADLTKLRRRGTEKHDVIGANLISTLLVSERSRIMARLKPGGVLVVAGVLEREFAAVRRAFERAGLKLVAARSEGEWRSGAFIRAVGRASSSRSAGSGASPNPRPPRNVC